MGISIEHIMDTEAYINFENVTFVQRAGCTVTVSFVNERIRADFSSESEAKEFIELCHKYMQRSTLLHYKE